MKSLYVTMADDYAEGGGDLEVAAGPATFCTSMDSNTNTDLGSGSGQISSCRERLVKGIMDNEDGEGDTATAHEIRASNPTTITMEFPACREPRSFSYRQVMFHLGIVLLLLVSLSAQHCSSEVVRLRHPEHLYYGDRGGGGISNHRHNSIISVNMNNEEYVMEEGNISPRSIGLNPDEESRQSPLPLPHHRSRNANVFSNIHKRKSHGINDDNFNSNKNYNASSSAPDNNNSGGDSSSRNSFPGYTNYEPYRVGGGHSLPQHETTGAEALVASEDRELPVYFARQGNDGQQEVEQLDPTFGGSGSSETPPPVEEDGKLFPPDLFTLEQRQKGAVVFYIMGVIYMFIALAIVCDEFFVPSLDVIIDYLQIQDDVAGATFMAAGGSAPELFTSVIGVFISKDDVGIGTIVGSAVFNILFVIGMCAIFSKTVLRLTWWPLFRDCSFYSVALITLIVFFQDSHIYWWEALILFSIYICYVTFMKFNAVFERTIKKLLFKNRVTRVSSTDQLVNNKSVNNGASSSQTSVQTVSGNQSSRGSATLKPPLSAQGRRNSIPMLHSGSKFRHGLLQLMIQSIDPLHDGRVDEKATQLHAIASLKALLDAAKTEGDATVTNNSRSKPVSPPQNPPSVQPADAPLTTVDIEDQANGDAPTVQELAALQEAAEEGHEPLDISWPKGDWKKQISYVVIFPIMILLYLTLPDTRTPRGKKFFAWGFLGSILWIAVFSYFMVWWADRTGETFGIAPEIMGLTFLAAGTSIPDLITSVIVARKGLGDMAVSSSVGSNIFDVCVGLPIPWLLYGIWKGEPVEVNAKGMLCSISILFGMLCFVVLSIMIFRWKMNKGLGLVMFILYFIFLGVSLLFEYNVITCPKFFGAAE